MKSYNLIWAQLLPVTLIVFSIIGRIHSFQATIVPCRTSASKGYYNNHAKFALSSDYLENDLLAIQLSNEKPPRLCAVKADGVVQPLCQREDDVETDLLADPREYDNLDTIWADVTDEMVTGTYGEGWYGQRPVPSLGGGPGYGAEADDIWSVDEELIEKVLEDGVELPCLDMGIAHGEKARGGSF